MQRIEYRNVVDKTKWGEGPWTNEPDKIQWQDEETGLPCLIVRGPIGALCGYVGVAPGHPWHGKGYDDVEADVHGGLTFAHGCAEASEKEIPRAICHIADPGEPDPVWWLGFDCGHAFDLCPEMLRFHEFNFPHNAYREISYVEAEVKKLAKQAYQAQAKRDG